MMSHSKELLLIFTRNPELGKCKTRLAATVGDETALEIYKFLLEHTHRISQGLHTDKWICYSQEIWENDIWERSVYQKKLQSGEDLGERMSNAFKNGFEAGHQKIIIIGSDIYDLSKKDIQEAFRKLEEHDYVIGPAIDGGYYLLGMTHYNPSIFEDKPWGTDRVLELTLEDLKDKNYTLLPPKNDIDYFEDIKDNKTFHPFFTNKNI
ncbi:glycosyltransferase [Arenibacter aquaticus]|uniref:Glycosyltransferase n=1 Tax=Arenibacter aquaticus TaxID=2489054 RepID=A0A3S0B024_9FLAO|nr:TIGR04282 family arsenosugar biosynthesis glycosyltransferase [Arenibacter aquaticus]RTE54481.1 glycosyltransferase [Arenibacter aquaticus]